MSEADTMGAMFLDVERVHERPAVLRHWTGSGWESTPDWRFHRHAIRIALYLRERLGVEAGVTVALLSPVTPAWALVCWATLASGATLMIPGSSCGDRDTGSSWPCERPRVAFAGEGGVPAGLHETGCTVVCTDTRVPDGMLGLVTLLDLGGTLDTAERATAFRARAREIDPGGPALLQLAARQASYDRGLLTHRDLVNLVHDRWTSRPPRTGDEIRFAAAPPSLESALSLVACIAGGRASAVF